MLFGFGVMFGEIPSALACWRISEYFCEERMRDFIVPKNALSKRIFSSLHKLIHNKEEYM